MSNQGQNLHPIGIYSFPTTSLFEISTYQDISTTFPKVLAILMFVPGKPDPSKQSNRTYDMGQKQHIKFSIEELFQLSYALEEAAATGQCQYLKFADTSKFKGGEKNIKKVSVNASTTDRGTKVFLNYEGGGTKITIPMDKYAAIGLSKEIYTLADSASRVLSNIKVQKLLESRQNSNQGTR